MPAGHDRSFVVARCARVHKTRGLGEQPFSVAERRDLLERLGMRFAAREGSPHGA
jgi:hypothetical protein